MDDIKTLGVVGCGQMGSGIAQVAASGGHETIIRDISEEMLKAGMTRIRRFLDSAVNKCRMEPAARDATLAKIKTTLRLGDLERCDLVIEAVPENVKLKKDIFGDLDVICSQDTILASNTSAFSITELAAATNRPDRVLGMHFFKPVPVMRLVELVKTLDTSDATHRRARLFVEGLGKTAILTKDAPGFVVNLLVTPFILDAIRVFETGVACKEDIDTAMKLGCGHPMGPLQLADYLGLDMVLRIADVLYDQFREKRYAAPPLLRRMVAAAHLGRKSGKGFYDYGKT